MRSRFSFLPVLLIVAMLVGGADGCSSDPNVEGAKLNLRNGEYEEALRNLDEALQTDPDNVEALALKAEVLRTQMDAAPVAERTAFVPDLRQSVERALTLAPENEDVMTAKTNAWAALVNTGNSSLQNEATPATDAVLFFEAAYALNPDSSGGAFGLGLAHLLARQNEQAATAFERALELEPAYTNASIYLARTYLQLDRGADALEVLDSARALVEDADRERLEQEYLNVLATSGQTDRAIGEFEQQIQNYPDDPLIRYNYGTLLLGVERYGDAIEQFETATELDSDNADAFYNLGVANLREAGRVETEAGELDLSQQDEYDTLIAQRDEFIEASLSALETARNLTTDANRPTVCNTLMTIYNSLGRADDAEAAAECAGVSMD